MKTVKTDEQSNTESGTPSEPAPVVPELTPDAPMIPLWDFDSQGEFVGRYKSTQVDGHIFECNGMENAIHNQSATINEALKMIKPGTLVSIMPVDGGYRVAADI